jgi:peptidoglycan hydrolase-like protein with peptidoglycan-binding domain
VATSPCHGSLRRTAAPGIAVQAKLRVSQPADPLEREADATADRIIYGGTDARRVQPKLSKRLDRDDELHGKVTGSSRSRLEEIDAGTSALGPGQPLPQGEREFFEPRFGFDFGRVRIHASEDAQAASEGLGARAFTRGDDIAFAAGQWSPRTAAGRRLLAHELSHVVQQRGNAPATVQRDLATPPPATAPAAQPDLTPHQIAAAIRFNRALYDGPRTREIQDLIGTKPTGTWTEDEIRAVAALQGEYGLAKDGRIGPATFRFLDRETRAERLAKTDKHCLVAFRVDVDPVTVGPVAGGRRSITGHHAIRAQFSSYCGCAAYEYRQFIRGHWNRIRGGVVTNLGNTFTTLPGGAGLTAAFREDGNTTTPALNYGHRAQANEGTGNGYFSDAAAATANQASGCFYRADDTPGGADAVVAGDIFDVRVEFRGEIRRGGRVVETKSWTDIGGRFPV